MGRKAVSGAGKAVPARGGSGSGSRGRTDGAVTLTKCSPIWGRHAGGVTMGWKARRRVVRRGGIVAEITGGHKGYWGVE
jgi:hypothetical protein